MILFLTVTLKFNQGGWITVAMTGSVAAACYLVRRHYARVNRAIAKAVTTCGCISVTATKQQFPNDVGLSEIRQYLQSHLDGKLCERCAEALESEIGSEPFYIAALCNLLDLDLETIRKKEHSRIKSLGIFNLK